MKSKNYEEFVEKFKPKLTTDDCYTPPKIYEIVLNWACKEYGIDKTKVVRPFYPGGDYKNFDYSNGAVVIDNPPFSILEQIKDFYLEKGIKFFLFAPGLTLFSSERKGLSYVVVSETIIFENGAIVNTSFVTNMEQEYKIRTSASLNRLLKDAQKKPKRKKYGYPKNVLMVNQLKKLMARGKDIKIKESECKYTDRLDHQKKLKIKMFGHGFLINDRLAKEIAKEIAKENAKEEALVFELSEREREIIEGLNANDI